MPGQLSDLVPDVLSEVAKCSGLLARKALEDATIQFFKDSLAYNVTLTEIPVVVDTAEYVLPNPSGYQIVSPRFAEFNRKQMQPTSEEALDIDWRALAAGFTFAYGTRDSGPGFDSENWRYATADRPWLYYCPTPNAIRVVGIPTTLPTHGLNINVFCHPVKGVAQIDDWIFNSWNDVITLRAVSQLKLMKDKPFTDLRGAAVCAEAYDTRVEQLRTAALRGHQRNNVQNLRVKVWK